MVDMGVLVGTVRRFGQYGPPYEVLGPGTPGKAGEPRMRVRLIETGEEAEHGVEHVPPRPVVAVCGCGKSSRKPWCDSTHRSVPGTSPVTSR